MTAMFKRVVQLCALFSASVVLGRPTLPANVGACAACTDIKTCNGSYFSGQTGCSVDHDICSGSGVLCQGS